MVHLNILMNFNEELFELLQIMFIKLGIWRLKITLHSRKEELGKLCPINFT